MFDDDDDDDDPLKWHVLFNKVWIQVFFLSLTHSHIHKDKHGRTHTYIHDDKIISKLLVERCTFTRNNGDSL